MSIPINLAKISPLDIPKFKRIIGGASNPNLPRAQTILSIIDARARQTPSTIMEKLGMMRLYHDNEGLGDRDKHIYWERAILEQVRDGKGVALLDRRRIVDYYGYRKIEAKKAFWLEQFVSFIQEHPTFENFLQIANWCRSSRAAFLQDLAEAGTPNTAANMLALQIYKALSHRHPDTYQQICDEPIRDLQKGFGFYERDSFGFLKTNILHPRCLDSLGVDEGTGLKIKQLSYMFLQALFSENLEWLYTKIAPQKEFEEVLTKKSADFKSEAILYINLGLQNDAQSAALSCFKLAKNSFEFKEATLILQEGQCNELAQDAALQSFNQANDYHDFIYAAEAFHKVGQEQQIQIAKQRCFQAIGEKSYYFVDVAVDFYLLGLTELAREAANMNYACAKTSEDLNGAIHLFQQNEMFDMAKEAANICLKIAKTNKDFECVTKNFKYLGLSAPNLANLT